jgi:hypothetical protein
MGCGASSLNTANGEPLAATGQGVLGDGALGAVGRLKTEQISTDLSINISSTIGAGLGVPSSADSVTTPGFAPPANAAGAFATPPRESKTPLIGRFLRGVVEPGGDNGRAERLKKKASPVSAGLLQGPPHDLKRLNSET